MEDKHILRSSKSKFLIYAPEDKKDRYDLEQKVKPFFSHIELDINGNQVRISEKFNNNEPYILIQPYPGTTIYDIQPRQQQTHPKFLHASIMGVSMGIDIGDKQMRYSILYRHAYDIPGIISFGPGKE